jgi:hypothetical protein
MESMNLNVVAVALRGASDVVAEHGAQLASPTGAAGTSAENAGAAAAAFGGALGGYRGAFSQRLSVASAALMAAADAFDAMEDANSAALAAVAPQV